MLEANSPRVAVVGSGISGLAASYMLTTQSNYQVTLYEKATKLGGHTNTFTYTNPETDLKVNVDCGFIVMNAVNYPNFLNFLNLLQVPLDKSNMSLSVSKQFGKFEYAGKDVSSLFCQTSNLFSLKFYRMLYDIIRFNTMAINLLGLAKEDVKWGWSIANYCQHYNYGDGFIYDYLLPFTSCVWSMDPKTCYNSFPIITLVQFMANHGLLNIGKKFQWLTVRDGAQNYVDKVTQVLPDVRLHTKVESISVTEKGKVMIEDSQGGVEFYDKVILATHANHSLKMLGDSATQLERELLGTVQFTNNLATLHTDANLMPIRSKAWSSWNYLETNHPIQTKKKSKKETNEQVCLTYWMNLLQNIDSKKFGDIFITLNSKIPIRPSAVIQTFHYQHPVFNQKLVETQSQLFKIQNLPNRNLLFVGAWTKFGFHEDGFTSGILAAQSLGVEIPIQINLNPGHVQSTNRLEWSRLLLMLLILTLDFWMEFVLLPICELYSKLV